MTRRILCLLLVLALLSGFTVTASASDYGDTTFVSVTVWNKEYRQLIAIPVGADLLFSAEDLAWMSDMTLTQQNTLIRFTRGSKTVSVQLIDPEKGAPGPGYEEVVAAMVSTNTKKLLSPAQKIDGKWYLSAASILPWLNVVVDVSENTIRVRPAQESLWDEWNDFRLSDHAFDFVACCDEMGLDSKELQTAAYIRNNGLKSILDLDLNNNGSTYQGTQNYLDLFDDFFMDKSSTDDALSGKKNLLNEICNIVDAASLVFMIALPEFTPILEGVDLVVKSGNTALDYVAYLWLFDEDNDQKLRIMDSFADELIPNAVDLDKNMKNAADKIRVRYRSLWEGLIQKALRTTVDLAVDELNSIVVLKALDLKWNAERPLNQKIDRIGLYDTIAASAKQTVNEGFGSYSQKDIYIVEDNAMLYLYCAEQNYRAMAAYIQHTDCASEDLMQTYISKADAAQEAVAKLLSVSTFAQYDASDAGKWNTMSKALQEGFEDLERSSAVYTDIGVTVDNAIYLTGLQEMGFRNLRWTKADMDRDGFPEILALSDDDGTYGCLVMDANNKSMAGRSFFSMDTGYFALLPSTDGVAYHPTYGFEWGGILSWDGHNLAERFYWSEGWENVDGQQIFVDYFFCDDEVVDYNVYAQKLEEAKIIDLSYEDRLTSIYLDSPNLSDVVLQGDQESLLRHITTHVKARDGFLASKDVNFDLDDDTDRLFIVKNALSETLLFARENTESRDMAHLTYLDLDWTLVLAERVSEGIHLRTCRIDEQYLENISVGDCVFEGEVLSVGENDFYYSAEGKPFLDAMEHDAMNAPDLLDFLDKTGPQIENLVYDIDHYKPNTFIAGFWDGGFIEIFFGPNGEDYTPKSLTFYPAYQGSTSIDGFLTTAHTRSELWEQIQPTSSWPEVTAATDPGGNVLYYGTTFTYTQNGREYYITLGFADDSPDSILQVIGITLKQ